LGGGGGVNVAVTVVFWINVTTQVPLPVQPPPVQPENTVPLAVRVIEVPLLKEVEQALPQLMPDGLEVTVPVPATTTARIGRSKVARTTVFALMVNSQDDELPANAQSAPHRVNNDVVAGLATMVSLDPAG
jgi:hypothetical protein